MKLYRKTDDKTYQGAPARDVTEEEFARLSPRARRVITQSGSWTPETIKKAEAPEPEAVPTTADLAAAPEATTGKTGKKG